MRTIQTGSLALLLTLSGTLAMNAAVVDLTTVDSSGTLNGAIYLQSHIAPSGSGVLDPFVRINPGGGQTFEQGYNTDARPLQYDENTSATFTHALQLSTVPIVSCAVIDHGCVAGTNYREFRLDINQTNADPLLSLDRVILFLRSAGNLTGGAPAAGSSQGASSAVFNSGTLVYDSGFGNRVDLNFTLEPGSGGGDMFLYIPDSLFAGPNSFVYLYSEFGGNGGEPPFQANDGFEEWAVRSATTPPVPEPKHILLTAAGALALFLTDYRRRRRNKVA